MNKIIKTYDMDGVISLDKYGVGIRPAHEYDIIITGRSYEEEPETLTFLHENGIYNKIYFNSVKFEDKTRKSSGEHKVRIFKKLQEEGYSIQFHYEDDPIQAEVIRNAVDIKIIMVDHGNSINLENERRIV